MSQPSSRPLFEVLRDAPGHTPKGFATPLSHPKLVVPPRFPRFPSKSTLARLSLLGALAMVLLPGCIVADPPQYEDPGRTPPFLNLALATPRVVDVQVINRSDNNFANDGFTVSVPVRSDDQGEELLAFVHLDYSYVLKSEVLGKNKLKASTLSDLSRKIDVPLTIPAGLSGCHQATLIVAHESSWDFPTDLPYPTAKDDTAIATWWLNVITDPNADPYTLTDCPNRNEVQRGN